MATVKVTATDKYQLMITDTTLRQLLQTEIGVTIEFSDSVYSIVQLPTAAAINQYIADNSITPDLTVSTVPETLENGDPNPEYEALKWIIDPINV